jgi:hypothetical protein
MILRESGRILRLPFLSVFPRWALRIGLRPIFTDRVELRTLVKSLQPGAVVVVTRLDRLARSTIDLLTTIKQIADKGCLFKSLADPWCDTTHERRLWN